MNYKIECQGEHRGKYAKSYILGPVLQNKEYGL